MIFKKYKKDAISWALYDWANSAFATTVMAGFFPIFYKSYWASDLSNLESTAMVGYANSLSGLIVVLLAPILGAYAQKLVNNPNISYKNINPTILENDTIFLLCFVDFIG